MELSFLYGRCFAPRILITSEIRFASSPPQLARGSLRFTSLVVLRPHNYSFLIVARPRLVLFITRGVQAPP